MVCLNMLEEIISQFILKVRKNFSISSVLVSWWFCSSHKLLIIAFDCRRKQSRDYQNANQWASIRQKKITNSSTAIYLIFQNHRARFYVTGVRRLLWFSWRTTYCAQYIGHHRIGKSQQTMEKIIWYFFAKGVENVWTGLAFLTSAKKLL